MKERYTGDKTLFIVEKKWEFLSFAISQKEVEAILEERENNILVPYVHEVDNLSLQPPEPQSDQNFSLRTWNKN